jgi:exodeoxyribonuclease VII large subunit
MSESLTWSTGSGKELSYLTLSDIGRKIKDAINREFGSGLHWVTAEISDMTVRKGHCYLSLVEKLPGAAAPVSEIKGIIWNSRFLSIEKRFKDGTGGGLASGTVILFKASVRFDVKWGLSLMIDDIEPAFTLGLIQQERVITIEKLKKEGVYENNRKLPFPVVPQRIALISAKDSRGYEDFMRKLTNNIYSYSYKVDLFPSRLQGDVAAGEIVARLIQIFESIHLYDIVVIVRGGGGSVDLNCFNDYRLSRAVARFPVPVISGIGHTANISVVDEVAFADRITPTDAADFIVDKTMSFEENVLVSLDKINAAASAIVEECDDSLAAIATNIKTVVSESLSSSQAQLMGYTHQLERAGIHFIKQCRSSLAQLQIGIRGNILRYTDHGNEFLGLVPAKIISAVRRTILNNHQQTVQLLELFKIHSTNAIRESDNKIDKIKHRIEAYDPEKILGRGYSITLYDNSVVKNAVSVPRGATIKTILHEGTIESKTK